MTEPEQSGVVFPLGADGRRSTTATGKAVWADAVRDVDAGLAGRIVAERDWRSGYLDCVAEVTAVGTRSCEAALGVARAGLASLAARMRFERAGDSSLVTDAVALQPGQPLRTHRLIGQGEHVRGLVVPYGGEHLSGDALLRQLDRWVACGTVEPSCAEALRTVIAEPTWLDLRDRGFALLGAGAELGPLVPLLGWGAHVAAVELPNREVWERLLTDARAAAGTLEVPVRAATATGGDLAADAGVDLLVETPEVADWVTRAAERLPLTVGSYAYADGVRHVLVAVASDAVVARVLQDRPGSSYAELATPTDAYAVPFEVVADARQRRRGGGPVLSPLRLLSRGALYAPAYAVTVRRDDGTEVGIADALVPQQGPNYTLAKRLQRWRAVVAAADGTPVSANVAPATSTRSVTKNRMLAAAYAGAGHFGVEVFAPETSRVLMAALLVHDLRSPPAALAHPDDLFSQQAAHGGLWRVPYAPRSILGVAAVRGLPATLRR